MCDSGGVSGPPHASAPDAAAVEWFVLVRLRPQGCTGATLVHGEEANSSEGCCEGCRGRGVRGARAGALFLWAQARRDCKLLRGRHPRSPTQTHRTHPSKPLNPRHSDGGGTRAASLSPEAQATDPARLRKPARCARRTSHHHLITWDHPTSCSAARNSSLSTRPSPSLPARLKASYGAEQVSAA